MTFASIIAVCLFTLLNNLPAQSIELLYQEDSLSIRGLSVVSDRIIWVSGNRGRVGRSVDGGRSWRWTRVKGFEKRDFRDIEAFDANTAVIMATAEPAQMLKTTDGGRHWKVVLENHEPGMFLDAMAFSGNKKGTVLGDPVRGRFYIAQTSDGGSTWQETDWHSRPVADSGEAGFAASGTNIQCTEAGDLYFVSGGMRSRLFSGSQPSMLPVVQGNETSGANSIGLRPGGRHAGILHMAVVGGNFKQDTSSRNNCFTTLDGGQHWRAAPEPPHGYRSCVTYISTDTLVTCGTTGVDISTDGGLHWKAVARDSYHVCGIAKKGSAVFLAGADGKVARLRQAISNKD